MFFEATGVGGHMASHVGDTWQSMWVTHGMSCVNMHGTWSRIYMGCGSCSYKQGAVRRKMNEKKKKGKKGKK